MKKRYLKILKLIPILVIIILMPLGVKGQNYDYPGFSATTISPVKYNNEKVILTGRVEYIYDYNDQEKAKVIFPITNKLTTDCSSIPTSELKTDYPNTPGSVIKLSETKLYDQYEDDRTYSIEEEHSVSINEGLESGKKYYYCTKLLMGKEEEEGGEVYAMGSVKSFIAPPQIKTFEIKETSADGNQTIEVSPDHYSTKEGNSVTLHWFANNVDFCSATGDWSDIWSGDENKNGTKTIYNISNRVNTFTLNCGVKDENNQTLITSRTLTLYTTQGFKDLKILTKEVTYDKGDDPSTTAILNGYIGVGEGNILDLHNLFSQNIDGPLYGYFRMSKVKNPPLFCNEIYGTKMIAVQSTNNKDGQVSFNSNFSAKVTNLKPDTQYAYCAIASNKADQVITAMGGGEVRTFTTTPCLTCPHTKIRTLKASNIGSQHAKLNGRFNTSRTVDKVWFDYKEKFIDTISSNGQQQNQDNQNNGQQQNQDIFDWRKTEKQEVNGRKNGIFSSTIGELKPNTIYQYRAWIRVKPNTDINKYPASVQDDLIQEFHGKIIEFKTDSSGSGPNNFDHCSNGIFEPGLGEIYLDEGGDCQLDHCHNGILDFGEGPNPDEGGSCGLPAHCTNGELDEDLGETDIDVGGDCPPAEALCRPDQLEIAEDAVCPDGYYGNAPCCDEIKKVPTVSVSADPTKVQQGGKTTITWSSTNATSCSANGESNLGTSGSFETEALENGKYFSVSCKGKGGTATNGVFVSVEKIWVHLTASPPKVFSGGSSTLSWSSRGATHCENGLYSGGTGASGSWVEENITSQKNFTVRCRNDEGASARDDVEITIMDSKYDPSKRVKVTVEADPETIYKGETSTITWSSEKATSCSRNGEEIGTSGSFETEALDKSQSFGIICSGEGGTGSDTAFVSVIKKRLSVDVWAEPNLVSKGGHTTIYWKASDGAEYCDAGVKSASTATDTSKFGGFSPINLEKSQTYKVKCYGPGDAYGEGTTRVNVVKNRINVKVWAKPSSILKGEHTTIYWKADDKADRCDAGVKSASTATDTSKFGGFSPINLEKSKTYTVECFGPGDAYGKGTARVNVGGTPAFCRNGIWDKDLGETEVDKGGPCGGGKPDHCFNGVQDEDKGEIGIDVGGICGYPPHCYNGVQDEGETSIDAGGECPPLWDNPNGCPAGFIMTSTGCIAKEKCPSGTIGIFPNCTFLQKCPSGTNGIWPKCTINNGNGGACPLGYTFVKPNQCIADRECPDGTQGTWPQCKFSKECPNGTIGIFPICLNIISDDGGKGDGNNNGDNKELEKRCPAGTTGIYPNCKDDDSITPIEHCFNNIQDFGETGIDIGGGCGGVWSYGPSCFDNIKNGDETGVDVGGHCGDGNGNNNGEFPSCFDNIKNGDETGVDVGGHCGDESKADKINLLAPEFYGKGITKGICEEKTIKGNVVAISPGFTGIFKGDWYAGNKENTGTLELNCEDGNCTGTLEGKTACINGPFTGLLIGGKGNKDDNGEDKIDWADMIFEGYRGFGILNGECVNGICEIGSWSGIINNATDHVKNIWTGDKGHGDFEGNCISDESCSGSWSGVIRGSNKPVAGTWMGSLNGIDEEIKDGDQGKELYIGYEGIPDVDDIVRYHEGVEHVFIRRIMINTELARRYGYKKGDNLLHFAWNLAHEFAKAFGYVNEKGEEIRVSEPNVSAYQLRQVGDKLTVYEFYQNKIIDIRSKTAVFKEKNSHEYYYELKK